MKNNAVIIKRIKKVAGGHHGGAWKVAYADFVTAMMAFFLLLWLLNATTDAQKRGIADYFSPTLATRSLTSGAGGVLGGRTMAEKGSQASSSAPPAVTTELNKPQDFDDNDDDDTPGKIQNPSQDFNSNAAGAPNSNEAQPKPTENPEAGTLTAKERADLQKALSKQQIDLSSLTDTQRAALKKFIDGTKIDPSKLTDEQFKAIQAAKEELSFEKLQNQLMQAIQNIPDLRPLAQNLVVERTQEGLNVEILDQEKTAMFPLGGTEPNDAARKLLGVVSQLVGTLPNKIKIVGHTDSTLFHRTGYDNWDLSTDRANASRRSLIAAGLPASRIASVSGLADTEPFVPEDPTSPRNRRISMVILREAKAPDPAAPAPAPDKP